MDSRLRRPLPCLAIGPTSSPYHPHHPNLNLPPSRGKREEGGGGDGYAKVSPYRNRRVLGELGGDDGVWVWVELTGGSRAARTGEKKGWCGLWRAALTDAKEGGFETRPYKWRLGEVVGSGAVSAGNEKGGERIDSCFRRDLRDHLTHLPHRPNHPHTTQITPISIFPRRGGRGEREVEVTVMQRSRPAGTGGVWGSWAVMMGFGCG